MFSVPVLQPLELTVIIDRQRQVVDLAHLSRFDLEFIILALADYDTLSVLLQILIVVHIELVFKREFMVSNHFMLMVHLIVNLIPRLSILIKPYGQVLKVILIHITLELVLYKLISFTLD